MIKYKQQYQRLKKTFDELQLIHTKFVGAHDKVKDNLGKFQYSCARLQTRIKVGEREARRQLSRVKNQLVMDILTIGQIIFEKKSYGAASEKSWAAVETWWGNFCTNYSIKPVGAPGQNFDEKLHSRVHGQGLKIVSVLQTGFTVQEKVLKKALVKT